MSQEVQFQSKKFSESLSVNEALIFETTHYQLLEGLKRRPSQLTQQQKQMLSHAANITQSPIKDQCLQGKQKTVSILITGYTENLIKCAEGILSKGKPIRVNIQKKTIENELPKKRNYVKVLFSKQQMHGLKLVDKGIKAKNQVKFIQSFTNNDDCPILKSLNNRIQSNFQQFQQLKEITDLYDDPRSPKSKEIQQTNTQTTSSKKFIVSAKYMQPFQRKVKTFSEKQSPSTSTHNEKEQTINDFVLVPPQIALDRQSNQKSKLASLSIINPSIMGDQLTTLTLLSKNLKSKFKNSFPDEDNAGPNTVISPQNDKNLSLPEIQEFHQNFAQKQSFENTIQQSQQIRYSPIRDAPYTSINFNLIPVLKPREDIHHRNQYMKIQKMLDKQQRKLSFLNGKIQKRDVLPYIMPSLNASFVSQSQNKAQLSVTHQQRGMKGAVFGKRRNSIIQENINIGIFERPNNINSSRINEADQRLLKNVEFMHKSVAPKIEANLNKSFDPNQSFQHHLQSRLAASPDNIPFQISLPIENANANLSALDNYFISPSLKTDLGDEYEKQQIKKLMNDYKQKRTYDFINHKSLGRYPGFNRFIL